MSTNRTVETLAVGRNILDILEAVFIVFPLFGLRIPAPLALRPA